MPTVVIIHAADDTLPARALAEKVRQAKLDVTLEKTGDDLRNAIKGAEITIGLWSPRSTGQPELVDHAAFAKTNSKLIHATMQSAPVPDQFRGGDAVNLTGWRGEDDFAAWRELAGLITSKAGVAPLPPPAPKPPSGFFQPGPVPASPEALQAQAEAAQARPQAAAPAQPQQSRPQQQPAAQRPAPQQRPQQAQPPRSTPAAASAPEPEKEKKGGGMMLIVLIVILVLGLGGGGAYWFMTQQNAQTSAYEEVDPNSAASLREFLAGNPSADDRERAEADLAALERATLDAAREANTVEAYEAFLREFPESDEAIYAQGQIQQLRLQETGAPPEGATEEDPLATNTVDPATAPPTTPTPAPAPTTGGPAPLTPPEEPPSEEPPSAEPQ